MQESSTVPLHTRVRRRAEELGITQAELGRAIGASQNTVSRFMRGKSQLALDQVLPLERAMQWPWGYVVCELGLAPREALLAGDLDAAIRNSPLTIEQQRTLLQVYKLMESPGYADS